MADSMVRKLTVGDRFLLALAALLTLGRFFGLCFAVGAFAVAVFREDWSGGLLFVLLGLGAYVATSLLLHLMAKNRRNHGGASSPWSPSIFS